MPEQEHLISLHHTPWTSAIFILYFMAMQPSLQNSIGYMVFLGYNQSNNELTKHQPTNKIHRSIDQSIGRSVSESLSVE